MTLSIVHFARHTTSITQAGSGQLGSFVEAQSWQGRLDMSRHPEGTLRCGRGVLEPPVESNGPCLMPRHARLRRAVGGGAETHLNYSY